jgi:hypothetical protein
LAQFQGLHQRLADLGFSADEITARLSELSDEQIHYFASKLDDLKVGGDASGFSSRFLL